MVGKYKVITLCGSTKFKDEFLIEQKRLTLEGNIVISVGLFGHSGDDEVWTENIKKMLDDMQILKELLQNLRNEKTSNLPLRHPLPTQIYLQQAL